MAQEGDNQKTNLRLLLVNGNKHDFPFDVTTNIGTVKQHVFDNWPAGTLSLFILFFYAYFFPIIIISLIRSYFQQKNSPDVLILIIYLYYNRY